VSLDNDFLGWCWSVYQPLEGLVVVAAEVVTVDVTAENGVGTVQADHTFPTP
jgi:hypothetical protein